MAQVAELLVAATCPHRCSCTTNWRSPTETGHEYGPHSDGVAAALAETDRRIGRVLGLLDERGLFRRRCSWCLPTTAWPQDAALRANPTAHVLAAGLAAIVAEPMIWLLDLAVEAERASDGRTGRVIVYDNDADTSGEQPPYEARR
ncbi:MAG: alkaline phosphatase family protein [Acidimicrobiaceae bacterium]|nr:alkaline phosphatase family protein [Acidimicrobiaceae bacterium]